MIVDRCGMSAGLQQMRVVREMDEHLTATLYLAVLESGMDDEDKRQKRCDKVQAML